MSRQAKRSAAPVLSLFRQPYDAARLFSKALALDARAETLPLARNLYAEVVRIAPGHVDAWNNLGALEQRLGCSARAMAAWAKALELDDKKAETHNNIGSLLQGEGKLEVASVYLLRAVKLAPDMQEARVNLALCLQSLGRRRPALRHWREYLARHPHGQYVKLARKHEALCSGQSEAVERAAEDWQKAARSWAKGAP